MTMFEFREKMENAISVPEYFILIACIVGVAAIMAWRNRK